MKIEAATARDLPGLLAIQQQAHGRDSWDRATWERELARPNGLIWVARDDPGRPVGYLLAWRVVDRIEIVDLAVSPSFRRQGIARNLVDLLKTLCAIGQIGAIGLEVRSDNSGAIAAYSRLGFSVVDEVDDFYQDGQGAYKMEWWAKKRTPSEPECTGEQGPP